MDKEGFVVIKNFASLEIVQTVRGHIESGEKWQGDLLMMDTVFGEILNQDSLKELLCLCLDSDNHLSSYCLHNLGKCDGSVSDWHVDYPTHDQEVPYLDRCQGVEGILALQPFNSKNGATQVMPGSHKSGYWPEDVENSSYKRKKVFLNTGDLLLFDSRLWHRAGKNNTERCRSALVFNFTKQDIEAKDDNRVSRGCELKKRNNKIMFK